MKGDLTKVLFFSSLQTLQGCLWLGATFGLLSLQYYNPNFSSGSDRKESTMRETRVWSLGQEDPLEEEPLLIRDFLLLSIQFLPLSDGCASLQTLFSLPQRVSHRTHCVLRFLSAQNDWQVPRTVSKKTYLPISRYLEDVLCCRYLKFLWRQTAKHTNGKRKKKLI